MFRRIVVIGGGVTGCSVAWHLSERGLGDVVVLERDRIGAGTTWHSAGNITWKPLDDNDAPVRYLFDLIDRFEADGEHSTGWLRTGRLFLARNESDLALYAPMAAEARRRVATRAPCSTRTRPRPGTRCSMPAPSPARGSMVSPAASILRT